jgi:O-antigen ligase
MGGRYWKAGAGAALVLFGLIVIRFPEMVPSLRVLRPVFLGSVVLVALFLSRSGTSVKRSAARDPVARLLFAFAVWAAITAPFALYASGAVQALAAFPYAFVLVGSFLLVRPTLDALERVHVSIVVQTLLLALYMVAFGKDQDNGRLTGTGMYDPNDLAALFCFLWPFCLALIRRRDYRLVALGALTMALVAFNITRTGSRGGLLGWIVGTILFYLVFHPIRLLKVVAVSCVCVALLWREAPPIFRDRAKTILHPSEDYNANLETGRVKIWGRGLGYLASRPITGVGLNNFSEAEGRHFMQQGKAAPWFTAHNTYIQVATELGIVGFGLFMGILWNCGRRTLPMWRRSKRNALHPEWHRPELFAALAAYMVAAFFLSLGYSFITFGVVAVLALAGRAHHASRTYTAQAGPGSGIPA